MKVFLFSVLGVMLLIPILYAVPIVINRKTKFLLIATSFLLAILGSMANQVLTLGNSLLVLFLLAGLSAYFIGKREIQAVGFNVEVDEELVSDDQSVPLMQSEHDEELFPSQVGSEVQEENEEEKETVAPPSEEEKEIEEMRITSTLEEDPLPTVDFFTNNPEDKEESDSFIREEEPLPPITSYEDVPADHECSVIEIEDEFILAELSEQPSEELETLSIELEEEELLKRRAILLEEWVEPQEEEELEGVVEESHTLMPILDSDVTDEESEQPLEVQTVEPVNEGGTIPKDLLYSLLEEIEWSRQHMPNPTFEEYLKEFLVPSLSDQDFYIFVSLLRDFYLSTEQEEKCRSLLLDIQTRFSAYPIIKQEIQYFLEKGIEKIDK